MMILGKLFAFALSPIGRYAIMGLAVVAFVSGVYIKGRADGRAAYRVKIEREIRDAVRTGNAAREKALRDFDALPDGELPNDGFRRD
jgi:hypothetical protein